MDTGGEAKFREPPVRVRAAGVAQARAPRIRRPRTREIFCRHLNTSPDWSAFFCEVANEIRQRLPAARVEHIGASSIPGAISKGDLDVFVGIARCQFSTKHLAAARKSGFREKQDTLRTPSLCMLESRKHGCDVRRATR